MSCQFGSVDAADPSLILGMNHRSRLVSREA